MIYYFFVNIWLFQLPRVEHNRVFFQIIVLSLKFEVLPIVL